MKEIVLHEVGPRDGLQMEKKVVPIEKKMEWVCSLMESGVEMIQIGSFVHPVKVPQMADTDQIFKDINDQKLKPDHVTLSGLVLNERGLDRALDCGCKMICTGVSASETHSKKNTGMTIDEAIERNLKTAQKAKESGCSVQLSVQSAFGCGYEGDIPEERVVGIVKKYLEAGFNQVSLADTMGYANPAQVDRLVKAVQALDSSLVIAAHFHDTYGLGIVNCHTAWLAGVRVFESAFAGLGGCPFTSIAGGNVCTEDLVGMLQEMGLRQDVDLEKLITVARDVAEFFQRDLPGSVYKVGAMRKKGCKEA